MTEWISVKDRLPVLEWLDANRPVVKGIERLLGNVRKVEKNTENRIYTPKSRREVVL